MLRKIADIQNLIKFWIVDDTDFGTFVKGVTISGIYRKQGSRSC